MIAKSCHVVENLKVPTQPISWHCGFINIITSHGNPSLIYAIFVFPVPCISHTPTSTHHTPYNDLCSRKSNHLPDTDCISPLHAPYFFHSIFVDVHHLCNQCMSSRSPAVLLFRYKQSTLFFRSGFEVVWSWWHLLMYRNGLVRVVDGLVR